MTTALVFILIGLLAVIVFQDFKNRAISWFLLPLLFIGFGTIAFLNLEFNELLINIGINTYIVFSTLLGATLIISIKNKKFTNIINTYLGLGDVLFFVVLTTVFSPINFVLFYMGSMIIAALIYGVISLIQKKQILTPLAGVMSLLLIITMVLEQFIPSLEFYQDLILPF